VPKIRALEIIDELEPVARGAYTGAVGVLGLDHQMTFNVAIRTLQFHQQTATLHVGGGIVADSDPAEEYDETLAKAQGIIRALAPAHGGSPTASTEGRLQGGPRA
jgi:anthranilate/para-aminobenzoate synthase component I